MSNGRVPANHARRYSLWLKPQVAQNLLAAERHALKIGRPLNRFVTIHLERGELADRPQVAIGKFLKLASQWLDSRGEALAFIWVLEDARGEAAPAYKIPGIAPGTSLHDHLLEYSETKGLHAHIMLHVPPTLKKEFGFKARYRWLTLAGLTPSKKVIYTTDIGPRGFDLASATIAEKATYGRQVTGLLRYHLKAIDPSARMPGEGQKLAATALGVRPKASMPIYGQRCGTSENIGKTRRERWNDNRMPVQSDGNGS